MKKSEFKPKKARRLLISATAAAILFGTAACPALGSPDPESATTAESLDKMSREDVLASRKKLYDKIAATTRIPWYRIAAVDQYEHTLTKAHPKDRSHPKRLT